MMKNKANNCSTCGQPIKTVRGAMQLKDAPLVCRRCFGEGSYPAVTHWKFQPVGPEANIGEG